MTTHRLPDSGYTDPRFASNSGLRQTRRKETVSISRLASALKCVVIAPNSSTPRSLHDEQNQEADRLAGVLLLSRSLTEVLELAPARFKVVRHVRPEPSCRTCERIVQAPLPSLPIERGRAGPGLLAHVLVSKYCDHLPLYRQSEIYARDGVDLARSTLAN